MSQAIKTTRLAALFVVGIFIAANSLAQSFLTNGLVAYYPFDGNPNDAVGTDNGTVNGAVLSTNQLGEADSAYLFNGSYSWIDFGSPSKLQFTNNFTLSAWCLFSGGGPYRFLFRGTNMHRQKPESPPSDYYRGTCTKHIKNLQTIFLAGGNLGWPKKHITTIPLLC
jgi:hypothetical protein